MAEDNDLVVRWLEFDRDTWRVEPELLEPLLSDRTRLLALNYASNLTGGVNDVKALTAMAQPPVPLCMWMRCNTRRTD